MKKKYFIIFLFFFYLPIVFAQEQVYFNTIYNPNNTYASGRGILQVDSNYYGIFGTWEAPEYYYKLSVFKMDLSGNLINWSIIGEDGHDYWSGSLGGTLISTNDGNLAFAAPVSDPVSTYGVLVKLTLELDTLWKREYKSEVTDPQTRKVSQTSDGGYIMVGVDYPGGTYYDGLLLKADSMGIEQWRQLFGIGTIYSEYLTNAIETPDGGYLIGGMRNETEYLDHTLDAMLIKTDSLGNEEWTQTYGNPDVDDDMALVAMADDGNYLVATVYGEWVVSPTSRTGRIRLLKIDNEGNTIWDKIIGPKERNVYLKNLRHTNDGNLIVAGWAYNDTVSEWVYEGLLYKFSQDGDSIWMRDYNHFNNQYDRNFFYDAYPTTDNGYIAIGKARPDQGGSTNKMWVLKVDSMGCDTPGCALGTQVFEIPEITEDELNVYPNPTTGKLRVEVRPSPLKVGKREVFIYNSNGINVKEINLPDNTETISIDLTNSPKGIYYLRLVCDGETLGTAKVVKN